MKLIRSLPALMMLLTLCAGVVHAADKADKAAKSGDVAAKLEENERKVQEAFKAKDAKTFMDMVDSDGWAADMTGFMPVSGVPDMMKDMELKSYTMEGFKALMIDHDAYVVTYTWKCEGSMKGQAMPAGPYYCSTVWHKKGNDWKAIYHQESLGMQPPPATESH